MKEWFISLWNNIKKHFKRQTHPVLTVPDSNPLSPCFIEPYVVNDGVEEENKAYMPVSLLLRALDDDRKLNIAVAGNYGVGKSSIINTAEQQVGKKHKFIKISLASLLTQEGKANLKQKEQEKDQEKIHELVNKEGVAITIKEEKSQGKEKDKNAFAVSDKQIEYSILQQILYHERPQKTPKSRMRRIHKTRITKPYWIAFWGLLTVISILLLIKPTWFNVSDYIILDNAAGWANSLFKWGPLLILAIVFILICRYCSRHYTFSLSRIGYKSIEMKITDEMSIFNAHMDEIVYFFESTDYDVVVFEDLDRFINKDVIFYKLRELNTVLNNCKSLKHKVNFVYAVLDHLFDATERVKFFDYIITVIPVINSLNSYNMLKKSIQPKELFELLGRNELLILCEYLQDMRLLLNIVNEFNQFVPFLDRSVMTDKILFGIVVYKNYAPSDFSKMYNKTGVVAGILERTDSCREAILKNKTVEIEQLKEEIKKNEEERDKRLYELRLQYLEKAKMLSSYPSNNLKVKIGENYFVFETIAKDPALFRKVREGQAVFYVNNSVAATIPSFNTVELNMGEAGHFDKSTNKIKNEFDIKIDSLKKKIISISNESSRLPKTVDGVYQNYKEKLDKDLMGLGDQEKQDLIKFLILNGYLDRDYQYYISYFYPNSLKLGDRNFVMKAGRHDGTQYVANLVAIDEVLKRFTPEGMAENESLLNVDLVRAIFQDLKYKEYRDSVCRLIEKTNSLDFLIVAYQAETPISGIFFFQLLKEYDFWEEIDEGTEEEQEILREIYVKFCDLREGKRNDLFKTWLCNHYAFLDKRWNIISEKRIFDVFEAYKPSFSRLSLNATPESVLSDILNNKRYDINRFNFNAVVKKLGFFDEYKSAAYTSLKKNGNQMLLDTVSSNWPIFLKSVFPETSTLEDDSAQVDIINATTYSNSPNEAKHYLTKQRNHIESVESLRDDVIDFAYNNSLVAPLWHNIYYYAVKKVKGLPVQFINKNNFTGSVGNSASKEEENALRRLIVFSDTLKMAKYEELVPSFMPPFNTIENKIQAARMHFIVVNNMLLFNEDNYRIVSRDYGMSAIFLVNNIKEFLKAPEKYSISCTDAIAAIKALNTKKAKCDFVRAIKNKEIIPNADLINLISPFIINGDLRVDDVNKTILNYIIAGIPEINRVPLGRKAILTLELSREEIVSLLLAIGGEFKRLTSNTQTSTITYSRDAVLILNRLVDVEFIKGYIKKGDKIVITKDIA